MRTPLPQVAQRSRTRFTLKASHRRISLKVSHRLTSGDGESTVVTANRERYIAPPKRRR